jgi:hypothetical protein
MWYTHLYNVILYYSVLFVIIQLMKVDCRDLVLLSNSLLPQLVGDRVYDQLLRLATYAPCYIPLFNAISRCKTLIAHLTVTKVAHSPAAAIC